MSLIGAQLMDKGTYKQLPTYLKCARCGVYTKGSGPCTQCGTPRTGKETRL